MSSQMKSMEDVKSSTRNEDETKDGAASSVTCNSEEDPSLRPYMTFKEKLRHLLHSHRFQIGVIMLVIFDCVLVIGELILDLRMLEHHDQKEASHSINHSAAPHILHYLSIAVLSVFIIEIGAKIYAFGTDFFRHKLEVFDAFVVFLSFALDVAFLDEESTTNAVNLIIVLRLWRVARVLNGIVLSVKTQSEHKLLKERRLRDELDQEMQKCRNYCEALENEISILRQLLEKHGINKLPPSVIEPSSPDHSTIRVHAEVNHAQPVESA